LRIPGVDPDSKLTTKCHYLEKLTQSYRFLHKTTLRRHPWALKAISYNDGETANYRVVWSRAKIVIIAPLADVMLHRPDDLLQKTGLVLLTEGNRVVCALVALSSDPVIQADSLSQLQAIALNNTRTTTSMYPTNDTSIGRSQPSQADSAHSESVQPVEQPSQASSQTQGWVEKLSARNDAVAEVVRRNTESPGVRVVLERILGYLMTDGAQVKSTGTAGGDLRFYFVRVNFAEIRFQKNSLTLRLRVGENRIVHDKAKYCTGVDGSTDIINVKITTGEVFPLEQQWIRMAQAFTRTKN
jgi:hypothetical protein